MGDVLLTNSHTSQQLQALSLLEYLCLHRLLNNQELSLSMETFLLYLKKNATNNQHQLLSVMESISRCIHHSPLLCRAFLELEGFSSLPIDDLHTSRVQHALSFIFLTCLTHTAEHSTLPTSLEEGLVDTVLDWLSISFSHNPRPVTRTRYVTIVNQLNCAKHCVVLYPSLALESGFLVTHIKSMLHSFRSKQVTQAAADLIHALSSSEK